MTTLHLGVIDIPYATQVPEAARRVVHRVHADGSVETFTAAPSGGETTGDVAAILEDKYHVMEVFYEDLGADLIMKALENSAAGAIESLLMGAASGPFADFSHVADASLRTRLESANTPSLTISARAEGEIEAAFRIFLDQREMDGVVPGVATAAAKKGVNHRFKHPYAKANKERPSFVDTGTYQAAFKAWVD